MKKTFSNFSFALLLGAAGSMAYAQQPENPTHEPASTCTFSIPSSKMSVCFNIDGNIMQLESPTGQEHLRVGSFVEGYVLCAAGFANSFDTGDGGAGGFGASVTLDGLPQPVTVRRDTTTGSTLRLTQELARDTNERDVSIIMTVTNLSNSTARSGVRLDRVMDIDANGSTNNTFVKDRDTAYGFNATLDGVSLNDTVFPAIAHTTSVQTFGTGTNTCNPASVALPATGDHMVRLSYDLGTIGPLSSKQVKIYYRRQ